MRTFIETGPTLLPLLQDIKGSPALDGYIHQIITAFGAETQSAENEDDDSILSAREIEVIQLISSGKSNKQIAEELVISLSTVKSHVHHICTKLNAANRTQAIAICRERGIIL